MDTVERDDYETIRDFKLRNNYTLKLLEKYPETSIDNIILMTRIKTNQLLYNVKY